LITLGILNDIGAIRHGFFTRDGGVSSGLYATLNVGFGSADDPANVAENRARAMAMLGASSTALATAYQVHGAAVAVVEAPWPRGAAPQVDGLVTRKPGLALGVLTADCAPVLLADPAAGIVAAAHAGWRGAKAGIIEKVVATMCKLGAAAPNIRAAIGPCIAQRSYEVGPEFAQTILGAAPEPEPASAKPGSASAEMPPDHDLFTPAPRLGRHLFDLRGYVLRRCRAAGIGHVMALMGDTFAEEHRFFSYRRSVLRGEPDYGRGLSAILRDG